MWRVWTTAPSNPSFVAPEFREGWLTFDSGNERRRLGPIPKGWEEMSPERLELLCRVAPLTRATDPSVDPTQPGKG